MKRLRLEVYNDPQRERVLVDGDEVIGADVELAFMDAGAGSMTVAELVGRFKRHVPGPTKESSPSTAA